MLECANGGKTSSSERRGKSIASLQGRCSVSIDKNYFTLLSVIETFQGCEIAPIESVSDNLGGGAPDYRQHPTKARFPPPISIFEDLLKDLGKIPKACQFTTFKMLKHCLNYRTATI